MFSYSGPNRPESKMKHMFRPVCRAAAPCEKQAVSDCIVMLLFLHCKWLQRDEDVTQPTATSEEPGK